MNKSDILPVLLFLSIILTLPPAHAHRPMFVEGATELEGAKTIPDPDISWAVYGELPQEKAHFYTFSVPEDGMNFFSQVLVPANQEDVLPDLALLGPGLPRESVENLPFEIPGDLGVVKLPGEKQEDFLEPFTQTRYLMGRELRQQLPQGTYYLAVYRPDGDAGKYTLAVGEREAWSWRDIFTFPRMWLTVRWWYSPGQTATVLALGALLMAAALFFVYIRVR